MKVLKATQAQYDKLNGFQKGVHKLEFLKDADGNWVTAVQVKENQALVEIKSDLDDLEEIDYNPIIELE